MKKKKYFEIFSMNFYEYVKKIQKCRTKSYCYSQKRKNRLFMFVNF